MLTSIFRFAHQGRRTLSKHFANCAKHVAYMVCADDQAVHLNHCYQNSQLITQKIVAVTKSSTEEIGFLCDFFEMRSDGFKSYSDLTNFWTEAHKAFSLNDERRGNFPRAFGVLWASKSFKAGYEQLSRPTQFFLNMSLAQQKSLLVKVLEYSSTESVRLG